MDSHVENVTLHVPSNAINEYNSEEPWKYFKMIVPLTSDDPKPTEIEKINYDKSTDDWYYSLDGKRTATPQRGLNIVKMSDGTTRKVIVK